MKKYFTALAIVGSLLAAQLPTAMAQTTAPTVPKKPLKKSRSAKDNPPAPKVISKKIALSEDSDDEDSEPETSGSTLYNFNCELGNRITIFQNEGDEKFVAIRWNKHVLRLKRVATSTGANRFENHSAGLVWIGIPAKSMLLDSKKGLQLANECTLAQASTQ